MSRDVFLSVCVATSVLVGCWAGCDGQSSSSSSGQGISSQRSNRVIIEYDALPSILIEAESGTVTPPVAIFEDTDASEGKYVLAPEGPDHKEISIGGDVMFSLKAPEPGNYVLWVRVKWSGACGNSLGVFLDGAELGAIGDPVYETWHWVRLARKTLRLDPAEHVLTLTNREDGSSVDQVLLTTDADYRPTGVESPS